MADKATDKTGKHRACKCGARTAVEHVRLINEGYPVHTWSGPKLKAK